MPAMIHALHELSGTNVLVINRQLAIPFGNLKMKDRFTGGAISKKDTF